MPEAMPSPSTVVVPPRRSGSSPVKRLAKGTVLALATLLALPWLISFWIGGMLLGRNRALEGASQGLACLPGITGSYIRRAFLARVLTRCATSADVGFGTLFSQCGAVIEDNVYIGPRCHLGLVHIERDVLIAAGVHIPSGGRTHFTDDLTVPIREQGGERSMVVIGEGAWIGSAAVVLADVGKGTIVGAGSVVTKPLPDFVIAAGVPARVIRSRLAQGLGQPDEGASA